MFHNIRKPVHISLKRQFVNTFFVLLFGIGMGVFSKFLDCTPSNELPYFMEIIDLSNFFGRIAIWYFLAVVIAVYSKTPLRAAVNVFLFFVGMLAGYYAYTRIFAGFYPDRAYFMLWAGLTVISPVLAFICWYARGRGKIAVVISSVIIAVLFLQAFYFSLTYFNMSSPLEVLVWIAGIAVLYKSPKRLAAVIVMSIVIAVVFRMISPFGFLI
ncbi:hypothetical protein FMM68_02980 [Lachnospiraceae bacterium MD329]|nr:hypothetical protein [Lachnospiraceae bacterium MD329]